MRTSSVARFLSSILQVLALAMAILPGQAAERFFFEAESMAYDGVKWKALSDLAGWYYGMPLGGKMLSGYSGDPYEAEEALDIKVPGKYYLWVRYLDTHYHGGFVVRVLQEDTLVEEQEFDSTGLRATEAGKKKWGDGDGQFVWQKFAVTLDAGEAKIVLNKADPKAENQTVRLIDCFLLTNDLQYVPVADDYQPAPKIFIKIKMGPLQKAPCVIHVSGHQQQAPWGLGDHNIDKNGMINAAYTGYKPGGPNKNFFTANTESPWINLAPILTKTGLNAVQFCAVQEYLHNVPAADFTLLVSKSPSEAGVYKKFTRSGTGAGMLLDIDFTKLADMKSDLELSKPAMEYAIKLPPVPGKRPTKFPVMSYCNIDSGFYQPATLANEITTLSILGLDGIGWEDPLYKKNGFTKFFNGANYYQFVNNACLSDYSASKTREAMREVAKKTAADGKERAKDTVAWMITDEPGSVTLEHLDGCVKCAEKYRAYLQKSGFTPQDFGETDWEDVLPCLDKKIDPVGYYRTMCFRAQLLADFFKTGTDGLRAVIPNVRTTANFGEDLTAFGNGLLYGTDWFRILGQDAFTYGWCEDWLNGLTTTQLSGYRADFMRAACGFGRHDFGMYTVLKGPWDTAAKAATNIGHGAKSILYYCYGPQYGTGADGRSDSHEWFQPIRETNFGIGAVEDYLLDTKVPRSKIGLLYLETTDIWKLGESVSNFGRERQGLYLLLRHLGYPVDVLTEQDVVDGKIAPYQVLLVDGSHMRRVAKQPLLQWIRDGGRLYCGAGGLQYDEFNRPLGLDAEVGLTRQDYEEPQNAGIDYQMVQNLKALETIDFQGQTLDNFCGIQKATLPQGATMLASFPDKSPALFSVPLGKGSFVFCGFFPGIAYLHSGMVARDAYLGGMEKAKKTPISYNPPTYAEGYRTLFAAILKGVPYQPAVSTSHYLLEANVLDGPKGLVVTLSNIVGKPLTNVTITVTAPAKAKKPLTAINPIKSVKTANGKTVITMDLRGATDFIVFPY